MHNKKPSIYLIILSYLVKKKTIMKMKSEFLNIKEKDKNLILLKKEKKD